MNRSKFIELVGVGSASIATAACFGACKKDSPTPSTSTTPVTPTPPNTTLFTLDLSDSANSALNASGGYVYKSGIIVAKTVFGNYIAVSQACTHQGIAVRYQASSSKFYCTSHGSNFNESCNGPAAVSLTKYTTSLSGNILSIKSLFKNEKGIIL